MSGKRRAAARGGAGTSGTSGRSSAHTTHTARAAHARHVQQLKVLLQVHVEQRDALESDMKRLAEEIKKGGMEPAQAAEASRVAHQMRQQCTKATDECLRVEYELRKFAKEGASSHSLLGDDGKKADILPKPRTRSLPSLV